MVLNLEEDHRELTKPDTNFFSDGGERLKRFKDPTPYKVLLGATAKGDAGHVTNVTAKKPRQWQFYKEVRISIAVGLSSMSHDIPLHSTLR